MLVCISELKIGDSFKLDLYDTFECFVKFKDDESVYFGVTPNPYRPFGGCVPYFTNVHIKPYGFKQLTLF